MRHWIFLKKTIVYAWFGASFSEVGTRFGVIPAYGSAIFDFDISMICCYV